ncbi:hypothetical protein RJT34_15162 [Clitoria ternatea]|uniref:Uncharacterized protein n=1 Tax=Clitoria ternatea TaxID=43366 RepID=A0AAN9JTV7_CLITE
MGISSSEEESDISESEKEECKDESYEELKAGKYKIKNANATFRCPFCEGKKKQAFQFKDLLQHASGIGIGSSKRRVKIKAKHLALAKYLKESDNNSLPNHELEEPNADEVFVWPWTVIVANVFHDQPIDNDFDTKHWLKRFEQYKPKEAHVLHSDNEENDKGYVVLEFGTEWIGFREMMKLDTDFLADDRGKKDWESRGNGVGLELYGWYARAEDYNSEGVVGAYLRRKTMVKTTSNIAEDALKEHSETVLNLAGEIDHANRKIGEVKNKYDHANTSLEKVKKLIEAQKLLDQTLDKEREMSQQLAREHGRRMMEEIENLQHDLDRRSAELDRWCQKLSEQETSTSHERKKLEEGKKRKVDSLILASEEQVKAGTDFLSLLGKHKMEKKTQADAILKLLKDMESEHKLKLEIAELEGQLNVLKHMKVTGADEEKRKKKQIQEMEEALEDLNFDMSVKEDENQALEKKEQIAKTQLDDARQQLIRELPKILKGGTEIGVKTLGEIDAKPFKVVCKNRYKDNKKASLECAKLLAEWQNQILDSSWHPFRVLEIEGKNQKIVIDEDDPKLRSLKMDVGEEAYESVVTALNEVQEYQNQLSGRSVIPELWHFKLGRIATLTETLAYIKKRIMKKR